MNSTLKKKISILLINFLGLILLLYRQKIRYDKVYEFDYENIENGEVLLASTLMKQSGIDVNWITGICVIFILFNVLMYRQWIKSKRWILEPILIFIISFSLTFTYHTINQFKINEDIFGVKKEMKTNANTVYNLCSNWN